MGGGAIKINATETIIVNGLIDVTSLWSSAAYRLGAEGVSG